MTALPSNSAAEVAPAHLTAERRHEFTVGRSLAEAFPLFEPIGEKSWAEGWQPRFATATDASLSDGTVFTIERAQHGTPVQTLWLITRYAPADGLIEYRSIVPGVRVSRITVQCRPAATDHTSVTVTYRYTGLSAEGDHYIANMTDAAFRAMIDGWDKAIRDFFKRGTPASP